MITLAHGAQWARLSVAARGKGPAAEAAGQAGLSRGPFRGREHPNWIAPREGQYVLNGLRIEIPIRVVYDKTEVRVWGRRRIHILERLIPVARRFKELFPNGRPGTPENPGE